MTDSRRPAELSHDEIVDLAASFVLGALDEDEMAAVSAHLASCAQSHAEFDELGGMVPVLQASLLPVEPPPALKDRIMAAAAADLEARRREATRDRGGRAADRSHGCAGHDTSLWTGPPAETASRVVGARARRGAGDRRARRLESVAPVAAR